VTAKLLDLPGVDWVEADPSTMLVTVCGTISEVDVRAALCDVSSEPRLD
jgi:hypothetical protein